MDLLPVKKFHAKKITSIGLVLSMWIILTYLLADLHTYPQDPCYCLKNASSQASKNSTCSQESFMRGPSQMIFSYTYFESSANAKKKFDSFGRNYLLGLSLNIDAIKKFFPKAVVRLYLRKSHHIPQRQDLCRLACSEPILDICDIENNPRFGNLSSMYPLLWRFLPVLDTNVEVVFPRDLDSVIADREVAALEEFLKSDKDVHSMRDHPQHNVPLLGGLWGAKLVRQQIRNQFEKSFSEIFHSKLFDANQEERGHDQTALKLFVWPKVRHDTLSHDSYNCLKFSQTIPFPTRRQPGLENFVGAVHGLNNSILFDRDNKCPFKCRPKDHKDWIFC